MQPITAELTAALKRLRYAFFVLGRPKDLREAFEGTKELMAKAEATQAAPGTSQAPSQVQPGQADLKVPCYCSSCGWTFTVDQPRGLSPAIYGPDAEWFCPHCGGTAHRSQTEPVEMPPKTDLACGCTHAGIMAGCPVHNASAPSPFNIHPEGNPQL